jgi:outer membrane receptor protein involved in Fe transport
VLGAEYRTDNVTYQQDQLVELGYTFYNAIPGFHAKKSKVKEAFGEIRIPIVKDVPFLQELEISGAARVSDYNLGNTGTVWAYNGSAIWSPIDGLRFRGNYGRSVRAPNQVELFSPPGTNFAPGFGDPCSAININQGSENRAANCAAAGVPVGYDFRYSQSLQLKSGGNPNLEAETSDSYTLGFVATPAFAPGFSLSVDWYKINVNKVITAPTPQQIINACYDLPDLNNQFCDLFQRADPAGGSSVITGGGQPATGNVGAEDPFQIIEGSLFQGPLNYAKLTAKGVDVEVAYRHDIGNIGKLDTRLTYTHVIDRSNYLDPTNPSFQNVIVGKHGGELGDPEDSFNWNNSLQHGPFTFGYQMRYIAPMYVNAYEDFNSVQGRNPENPDYAEIHKYPARWYHDVRLGIDATKNFNFYMGIDNLTNTKAPLGLTGIGAGSGIYDVRGRFYYAGVTAKF